jgi:hypothetical protein
MPWLWSPQKRQRRGKGGREGRRKEIQNLFKSSLFWSQGLLILSRLASNWWSSHLSLLSARIPGVPCLGLKFLLLYYLFIWDGLNLNSGLHTCKAGALMLEQHLSLFYCYFGDGGCLSNYLPRLALNFDPPDLSLPSS